MLYLTIHVRPTTALYKVRLPDGSSALVDIRNDFTFGDAILVYMDDTKKYEVAVIVKQIAP